jgi:ABC-type multidrug transport system fused ATPase/permease subunit
VAIVGPTGAGKTTLVNLMMRFYQIDTGRITLDGVDVTSMTRHELRSLAGMVLQDTWLFGGTIRDNIAYGRPEASEAEILEAAQATYVDRFVRSLPEGYDTVLDDEGSNVSAGEKQLLTIARAFLSRPSVLILDEATSSVDTRTEVLVQKAMSALRSDRTSFVIAHRLSTIRDADLILMIDAGDIVEQGTHIELLAAGGATENPSERAKRSIACPAMRRINLMFAGWSKGLRHGRPIRSTRPAASDWNGRNNHRLDRDSESVASSVILSSNINASGGNIATTYREH